MSFASVVLVEFIIKLNICRAAVLHGVTAAFVRATHATTLLYTRTCLAPRKHLSRLATLQGTIAEIGTTAAALRATPARVCISDYSPLWLATPVREVRGAVPKVGSSDAPGVVL